MRTPVTGKASPRPIAPSPRFVMLSASLVREGGWRDEGKTGIVTLPNVPLAMTPVAPIAQASPCEAHVLILMRGHSYNTAGALRAEALAEDMEALVGLLMPGRNSVHNTTAGARCESLCLANRAREHLV